MLMDWRPKWWISRCDEPYHTPPGEQFPRPWVCYELAHGRRCPNFARHLREGPNDLTPCDQRRWFFVPEGMHAEPASPRGDLAGPSCPHQPVLITPEDMWSYVGVWAAQKAVPHGFWGNTDFDCPNPLWQRILASPLYSPGAVGLATTAPSSVCQERYRQSVASCFENILGRPVCASVTRPMDLGAELDAAWPYVQLLFDDEAAYTRLLTLYLPLEATVHNYDGAATAMAAIAASLVDAFVKGIEKAWDAAYPSSRFRPILSNQLVPRFGVSKRKCWGKAEGDGYVWLISGLGKEPFAVGYKGWSQPTRERLRAFVACVAELYVSVRFRQLREAVVQALAGIAASSATD